MILSSNFGMNEVKAVVDAYPCDSDMGGKQTVSSFCLSREIAIGEGS